MATKTDPQKQQEPKAETKQAAPDRGKETARRMWSVKGLSMEKWLCWGSMGVSGFILLLFLLDLILKFPFGGLSMIVDIFGILASAMVCYLAWDAFKDVR
jgi:hypothetical protein